MSKELEYLFHIYNCDNINQVKKYLFKVKDNFHKLNKKEKKKYLELMLEMGKSIFIEDFLGEVKEYYVYYNKESLKRLILKEYIYLNLNNFDIIIDNLVTFLSSFEDKKVTKKITKKEIDNIFELLNQKIEIDKILKDIRLNIYLLNCLHQENNSLSIPSSNLNEFIIVCFYLKDNEEYQKGMNNPIYVFLHELGHVICWIVTQKIMAVPDLFFKSLNKFFPTLDKDNPDALEVFADCFAMYAMHNTSLDIYNPFTSFSEEFYICLENFFETLLKKIKE